MYQALVTNPFLCKQIHKHTRTRSHVGINAPPTKPAGSASGEAYLTEGQALRKGKLGTTQAKAGTHKQMFFLKESRALHIDEDGPVPIIWAHLSHLTQTRSGFGFESHPRCTPKASSASPSGPTPGSTT